jgi:hypothetical protein
MKLRRSLLALSLASLAACGKSRDCQRFADLNVEHADAIEGVIVADFERFSALTKERLGREPPPRVREAALRGASQWRETLTDPLLAQTCTADWPEEKLATIKPCLEHETPETYALCVLDGLEVPLLGRDSEES